MARVMRPVRSGPSRRACFLRFINCTSRKADVVWIDYNGFPVNYGTLEPERHFDIHTYEGHPWFCTDATLRTRLLLNKEKIFYPSASDQENAVPNRELRNNRPVLTNKENIHNENDDDLHQCRREIVYITIPVLSLLQRSVEIINTSIRKRKNVFDLNIPTRLKYVLYESQYERDYNIP